MDCYAILNCSRNATKSEIKKNYFQLAKVFHPDKSRTTTEQHDNTFLILEESYRILSNNAQRFIYDNFGHDGIIIFFMHEKHIISHVNLINNDETKPEDLEKAKAVILTYILLKEVEQLILKSPQYQTQFKMNSFSMKLNCQDLLNYYYDYIINRDDYIKAIPHLVHFDTLNTDNTCNIPLNATTVATIKVTNNCLFRRQVGSPALMLGFQKKFAHSRDFGLRVNIRENSEHIAAHFSQAFFENKFSVNANFNLGKEILEPGIGFSGALTKQSVLRMDYFPISGGFTPAINYRGQNFDIDLISVISRSSLKLLNICKYRFSEMFSISAKVPLALNHKIGLNVTLDCAPSQTSSYTLSFSTGYMKYRGFYSSVKFGINNWGFNLKVPIILGSSLQKSTVAVSLGITGIAFYLWYKAMKTITKGTNVEEENQEEKLNIIRSKMSNLIYYQDSLFSYANLLTKIEEKRRGLVVEKVLFGYERHIKEIIENKKKLDNSPKDYQSYFNCQVIDLTVILQTKVNNGKLLINKQIESIPGVFNPVKSEKFKSILWIKWKYNLVGYSEFVNLNDDELEIP